ncbi:hypothetical protein ACE193_23580 [Bernardetia sp. OM2101]|uniref:hypothetical protein n=1 Tax=Bernardetia sp. OM2101 TaxID=3344876 RepID=UPI0035D0B778
MKTAYQTFLENQKPSSKVKFAEREKQNFHKHSLAYKIHSDTLKKLQDESK